MEAAGRMQDVYQTTEIWKCFFNKADEEKRVLVKKMIDHAHSLLDRYSKAFPTYTLHNGQHQLNVLNLYADLLGEKVQDLTALESAILILSAFYHDIGMVYEPSEKGNIQEEENFIRFLENIPSAKLKVLKSGEVTPDIIEWYCRWCHAERVWVFLNPLDTELVWDGNHFREALAEVCLSHNESCEYIKGDTLPIDYWGNTDLKFCAILLRLADLLDFDKTRAPESLYRYLKLDQPRTEGERMSQQEWQKHAASKGFDFCDRLQKNHYTLKFRATPTEPSVEYNIRCFLDQIEQELRECISILRFCSDRWKDFKLPEKIDRKQILSQGYEFGDFKFTLDQKQILNLLMGENLYANEYVFIRELLQNAIDTSRHRKFYEVSKGQKDFKPQAIQVTSWHDSEGFRWVRADDFGMGMTVAQISDFFLKVGKSYYNSVEFEIEKLTYQNGGGDFTPVSRFGIGILSCFICGDVVEVNTKSVHTNRKDIFPVRLSLRGIDDYYVLQTGKNLPDLMPSVKGGENTYRNEPGTSVAVRIRPNYDLPDFDLKPLLNKVLFNPEVEVRLGNGEEQGSYLKDIKVNELQEECFDLPEAELAKVRNFVGKPNLKLKIHKYPLSLTKEYVNPDIKGLLYLFTVECKPKLKDFVFHLKYAWKAIEGFTLRLKVYDEKKGETKEIVLSDFLKNIEIFNGESYLGKYFSHILLSHNGIIIENNKPHSNILRNLLEDEMSDVIGHIELSDKLRPNLNVDRNAISSFNWKIWSHLNYTIRKNIPQKLDDLKKINYLDEVSLDFEIEHLNEDILLTDKQYWCSEKIFGNNSLSLLDILNEPKQFNFVFDRSFTPENILKTKIIELHANYKIVLAKRKRATGGFKLIKTAVLQKRDQVYKTQYQPLTFCEYENFQGLMPERLDEQILNMNHPFSQWIINSYDYLSDHYSNQLNILLNNTDLYIVNNTIETLRNHLPDLYKPADNLRLTEDDFEVDYDALPEI